MKLGIIAKRLHGERSNGEIDEFDKYLVWSLVTVSSPQVSPRTDCTKLTEALCDYCDKSGTDKHATGDCQSLNPELKME